MKRAFLFILIPILFILISCNKNDTIVNNPKFENSNTNLLEISKIELTDTATILHVDVYNSPNNWIRIASSTVLRSKNKKEFKLIKSSGFDLDKQVFMPESGHISCILFFEPVEHYMKTVDFIEGENEGDFQIKGIKLHKVIPNSTDVKCTLKGEVINRPYSSRLTLTKYDEDSRSNKVIYIPIRDGKFEYTLNCNYKQAYELVFFDEELQGRLRSIDFIAENDTINFTLYPMDKFKNNIVKGGELNTKYQEFEKERNNIINPIFEAINEKKESLEKTNKYYTPEISKLIAQVEAIKDYDDPMRKELINKYTEIRDAGNDLMPEAKALQNESNAAEKIMMDFELNYAKENSTIVGYTVLLKNFKRAIRIDTVDIAPLIEIYSEKYKPSFYGHPYHTIINDLIKASEVKVGNKFINITAYHTVNTDRRVELSSQIRDKIALIHLWASWCSPCREKGKAMIPVYEKYKDKGFTVVGIAREKSPNALRTAIGNDKYPWLNLMELNDRGGIWAKYKLGNSGGGDFLVDKDGIILAVNPTVEEVADILENMLQ